MKIAFGLLAIVLLGIFLVYQFGIKGFDPAGQAQEMKKTLAPGMDWTAVADRYPPKKIRLFHEGGDDSLPHWTRPEKFDRAAWTALMAKTPPAMFAFHYMLSAEHIYDVRFNGAGKMTEIEDIGAQAKELQMHLFGE